MKQILTKITTAIAALALAVSFSLFTAPAFADTCQDGVPTAILGEGGCFNTGSGEDEGINHVLNLVVDIMTIGIGVLGVLGITIVGIQYLTAGGSEEKVRKAKRRMFAIIIGLVVYVLIYAILQFLRVQPN